MIEILIVFNVLGIVMMAIDKWKAKRNLWRISEKFLFLLAIMGGSLGIEIGMYMFHHKTKKAKFVIGIPILIIAQIIMLYVYWG